jgi:hypothetical protein
MAVSIDCGTAYYISARTDGTIKKQNNAFLTLDEDPKIIKRQLSRLSIPYVELHKRLHIIGKYAFDYANIFSAKDLRRPMRSGLLNPTERDALPILREIIKELLGPPAKENEVCVYCVPAAPIDDDALVDYHEDVLSNIIASLGYKPIAVKEAVALAYHGLVDDELTGIAISLGAGMANCSVLYAGMDAINFSVRRGGDWVDERVSQDTGVAKARVQFLKESGEIDLSSPALTFENGVPEVKEAIPKTQVHQAMRSYYGVLVSYILNNISNQFLHSENMPSFPKPVPIIIGGGTAMVPGFMDVFKEQLEKIDFPIEISDIRIVENTHEAVALGCLNEALLEEGE